MKMLRLSVRRNPGNLSVKNPLVSTTKMAQNYFGLSYSENDLVVRDLFLSWWTSFAKTGKPDADDSWKKFNAV